MAGPHGQCSQICAPVLPAQARTHTQWLGGSQGERHTEGCGEERDAIRHMQGHAYRGKGSLHSFIPLFIRSFIYSTAHCLVHAFIHPSTQSFTHSFIHPSIHSSIHPSTPSQVHMHPVMTLDASYMSRCNFAPADRGTGRVMKHAEHPGCVTTAVQNFDSRHPHTAQANTRHETQGVEDACIMTRRAGDAEHRQKMHAA